MVLGCGVCLSSVKWNIEFSNSNCVPGLAAAASELSAHRVRPIYSKCERGNLGSGVCQCVGGSLSVWLTVGSAPSSLNIVPKSFHFCTAHPLFATFYHLVFQSSFSGTNGNLSRAKCERTGFSFLAGNHQFCRLKIQMFLADFIRRRKLANSAKVCSRS